MIGAENVAQGQKRRVVLHADLRQVEEDGLG
jgi:hypothetical protein